MVTDWQFCMKLDMTKEKLDAEWELMRTDFQFLVAENTISIC